MTTRDRIGRLLDGIGRLLDGIDGLVVPPVARFRGRPGPARVAIDRAAVGFPAILRQPGTHNGDVVGLVADVDAMLGLLDPAREYLLTRFVDIGDADGLFHKIRVYYFGDMPVVRHLIVSDRWQVHGSARERVMIHRPDWIARERALLEAGIDGLPAPARAALATMNFFPLSTEPAFAYSTEPVVAKARAAVDRMIERAMG